MNILKIKEELEMNSVESKQLLYFSRLSIPESSIETTKANQLFGDYDERSWFGESGVPNLARDPIAQFLELLKKPQTMGNLEALIRSLSFIR
ncbi:unnamed protein product [Litomosoides sigmodontis]|uniref:Uncharacterized protein n=1 Tax=Litomosoides sigmodontis TaxID=42156 RepID=A0A3P6TJB1_LITSI|nr:unnamed protein product [Litomosoides sigmodontis]